MGVFTLGTKGGLIGQAAWIARCVGRASTAPVDSADLRVLAAELEEQRIPRGGPIFAAGTQSAGVWIVRDGRIELSAGSGLRRVILEVLRPGDVDGDLQLLMGIPIPYTGRAVEPARLLFLPAK